ncbi:MAG: hypothetical protein GWM87_07725, partial [Xanthomonadales bacterium]|nr:hypothetical protein [Xanthomonadales bacterium]NIX12833.1 hypothetical protein [Xanthomonadales bacterium]
MDTISLDADGNHVRIAGDRVDGVSEADQAAMQEYRRIMQRGAGVIASLHDQVPMRLG